LADLVRRPGAEFRNELHLALKPALRPAVRDLIRHEQAADAGPAGPRQHDAPPAGADGARHER
jgi:hypothetical protein